MLKCAFCEAKFWTSAEKSMHELHTHDPKKPYQCRYCPQKLGALAGLKNHERIHTGELPYECPVCNKKLRTSSQKSKCMNLHRIQAELNEKYEEMRDTRPVDFCFIHKDKPCSCL